MSSKKERENMVIRIKQIDKDLPVPKYAYAHDAGFDLYSSVDVLLESGERKLIPTGVAVAILEGYAGFVQPRSGLAAKHGISIVNSPGLIDSHYRGEIKVILINLDKDKPFQVRRGDKIAQLIIQKIESVDLEVVDELDETVRGAGGFGSSGR
jgi:dUTP pyrophosphatase